MYLKNGDFCPTSAASSALTGTKVNEDLFTKKIALPISYATLMTYVPVLGAEQF